MFGAILEIFGLRLASRFSDDLDRRWRYLARSVKRTAFGALLLQVSGPFFVIGIGLLLAALFISLTKFGLAEAALWTGAASLAFGLLVALVASSSMRQ